MSGCWRRSSMPARKAVVESARRHLYVLDGNIRPVREVLPQQILRVPGLCDDLHARRQRGEQFGLRRLASRTPTDTPDPTARRPTRPSRHAMAGCPVRPVR
jgi:hypothetical protein